MWGLLLKYGKITFLLDNSLAQILSIYLVIESISSQQAYRTLQLLDLCSAHSFHSLINTFSNIYIHICIPTLIFIGTHKTYNRRDFESGGHRRG